MVQRQMLTKIEMGVQPLFWNYLELYFLGVSETKIWMFISKNTRFRCKKIMILASWQRICLRNSIIYNMKWWGRYFTLHAEHMKPLKISKSSNFSKHRFFWSALKVVFLFTRKNSGSKENVWKGHFSLQNLGQNYKIILLWISQKVLHNVSK